MSNSIEFDGDVVIVTGAAGGLGHSQAIELGRRGARVLVNDLDHASARDVVDEIRSAGGEAASCTASVASETGPEEIVATAIDAWGRVDALIHNAAILRDAHLENVSDADFDEMVSVNLRGTFRTVRACYRSMMGSGGGRLVTVTSNSGLSGAFGQSVYAATKMGVIGLTRSAAWEGMRYGIKANALAPSAHDTRMSSVFTPEEDAALQGRPPELQVDVRGTDYAALMTASRVTPMALALAHESCPATSEIFGATGGYYHRFAISHTEGATFGLEPTVEDVVEGWDRVRGDVFPNELDGEAMAWGAAAYASRLNPLAAQMRT